MIAAGPNSGATEKKPSSPEHTRERPSAQKILARLMIGTRENASKKKGALKGALMD
jgi:hypothetical protein